MNKLLITLAVVGVIAFAIPASADTCGVAVDASSTPVACGNGSPESVVGPWGFTNSQLPHILQGQSVVMSNGITAICPFWFAMYCVDISHTQYFLSRWGK